MTLEIEYIVENGGVKAEDEVRMEWNPAFN